MSTASNFLSASNTQSVCQTSAFIGAGHAANVRRDTGIDESFSTDLSSCLQVQMVPIGAIPVLAVPRPGSLTTIVSEAGASWSSSAPQASGADSMVSLLQGLEAEISRLTGELQSRSEQRSAASCSSQNTVNSSTGASASGGLQGDYLTLYNEAVSAVQDGNTFNLALPSGETLSGSFSWGELEPAGDNALFTPGNPSAPDAGRQAFDNAIAQFLSLAQGDSGSSSATGEMASYSTATSFAGNDTAISWSGTFSLAPANAVTHKN